MLDLILWRNFKPDESGQKGAIRDSRGLSLWICIPMSKFQNNISNMTQGNSDLMDLVKKMALGVLRIPQNELQI